jgi:acetyltransferase
MDLNALFNPKSVAVIGASRNPEKVGGIILRNLRYSFNGEIYPVNPNATEIQGLKSYKSVKELKGKVDLAIIVVPAPVVLQVLKECEEARVKFAIIISAGFKEIGGEGVEREEEIKNFLKKAKIRVVGPNCMGIIDTYTPINTTFVETSEKILKGDISFISQSGALLSAIVDISSNKKIGFSKIISVGNAVDIDEADVLEYLADDENTKAIFLYLEGISDGKKFIEKAAKAAQKKPVFIIKGGKNEESTKAVKSHTGSMAGSYLAYKLGFKRSGIVEVETIDDLFNLMRDVTKEKFENKDVIVVTNSGGAGVITVDAISKSGLKLHKFDARIEKELEKILPPESNKSNPIDVLGDATPDRYKEVLDVIGELRKPTIVIFSPQEMSDPLGTAKVIVEAKEKYNLPVFAVFLGGSRLNAAVDLLLSRGIPTYQFPEEAVDVIAAIASYNAKKRKQIKYVPLKKVSVKIKKSLFGIDALEIFHKLGVNTPRYTYIKNNLTKVAEEIGFPMVIKANTPEITHKDIEGLVKLGINSLEEMKKAIEEIKRKLDSLGVKDYKLEAYEDVNKYSEEKLEVLVGSHRDEQFGNIILIGFGGTMANIIEETFPILSPITQDDIKELENSKIGRALMFFDKSALNAIVEYIKILSSLVESNESIKDVDLNPIIVTKRGNFLVDAKIFV